jgi:hypothetical protein
MHDEDHIYDEDQSYYELVFVTVVPFFLIKEKNGYQYSKHHYKNIR